MTIRELMSELSKYDPNDEVLMDIDEEFVTIREVEPSDPSGMVMLREKRTI